MSVNLTRGQLRGGTNEELFSESEQSNPMKKQYPSDRRYSTKADSPSWIELSDKRLLRLNEID
jgi:hypothetical protein